MPVLLVTVIATAIGGLLARQLYEDPGPGEPDAVLPTQTSVPPEEQPGSRVVQGTPDAVAHPLYEAAKSLLQTHFDAINDRDYESWTSTVVQDRTEATPEQDWRKEYRSTQDGGVVIYRIELAPEEDKALALITFTSVQDRSNAPVWLPEPCIHWNMAYPLVREDGDWRIDSGPATQSPQAEACA